MRVVSLAHRGARDGRGRTAPPAHLMSMSLTKKTRRSSNAPSPGELPGLEAFFAEDRTPLCRLERHRRFLAACRAGRQRFDPFTRQRRTGRTAGPFGLAGFAPLRLV